MELFIQVHGPFRFMGKYTKIGNINRKFYNNSRVEGYALDYQAFNVSGYILYGFYCSIGYFTTLEGAGTVVISDLIFVYHALLMVFIMVIQSLIYKVEII